MDNKLKLQLEVFLNTIPKEFRIMFDIMIADGLEEIEQENFDELYRLSDKAKAIRDNKEVT